MIQLYIYMYLFFFKFFAHLSYYRILSSSLCYTIGPCWLYILNIAVCTCRSQTPNLSLPPPPFPLVTISSFSKSVSLFLFCKLVHLYHFFKFRFLIKVISCDICLFFFGLSSLSMIILGPSMLLQMALFHSF